MRTLTERIWQWWPIVALTVLIDGVIWAIARFGFLTGLDAPDLWDAQMSLVQNLVLANTLVLVWSQSEAALRQLDIAKGQHHLEEVKTLHDQIEELKANKPIAFTDRLDDGQYRITNKGGGLAANVWYLVEGRDPVALGSLRPGEHRTLQDAAERHLLIAEARPATGRMFTPTINVLSAGNMCHGFIDPGEGLKYEGPLSDYLRLAPKVLEALTRWQPGECWSVQRTIPSRAPKTDSK